MKIFGLVPVKELSRSKERLSVVLKLEERIDFVLSMLEDVLGATKSSMLNQTVVVGSDAIIQRFAERFGASFLPETRRGLNNSLRYATAWCVKEGAEAVLILPVDIPLIMDKDIDDMIRLLSSTASIIIAPSKDGGTNALMLHPANIMKTCFGQRSFEKHINEATRRGVPAMIYQSRGVTLDIDSLEDLKSFLDIGRGKAAHNLLVQHRINQRLEEVSLGRL